jgi:hypothetical protein
VCPRPQLPPAGLSRDRPAPAVVGLRFEVGDALHHFLDTKLCELGLLLERRERPVEIPASFGVISGHFDRSVGGTTVLDYKNASRTVLAMINGKRTPLMQFYARKKQEKGAGKALCATARKLLTIIFVMLKRDLDYWYLEDRLYQRKLQMLRTSA